MNIDMVWAEIAVAALAGSGVLRHRRPGRAGDDVLASLVSQWIEGRKSGDERVMKQSSDVHGGGVGRVAGRSRLMPPTSVALQLKWVTQAQFAGYYVAKDKGFYEEEPRRRDQAGRPGHRAGPGAGRRRCRRDHRLDAVRARLPREGHTGGQHRPALQQIRNDADLPQGDRYHRRRRISAARLSASGSSATSIPSSPGCRNSAFRPMAATTASRSSSRASTSIRCCRSRPTASRP